MDTKQLEKFCPWARAKLMDAIDLRCARYSLDDAGRAEYPMDSDVVTGGKVLAPAEKSQRTELFRQIERDGYATFLEAQASSWFNRLMAIRYMELNDYLPSHVRMLSSTRGSDEPDCIATAIDLDLPGLDQTRVFELINNNDTEELYRQTLLAQCRQLAQALPGVFGQVSVADALTLPDKLVGGTEGNVRRALVTDVPEECWQGVEALGWAYQFYNSERKAKFFDAKGKSKRKAMPEDIAPATQLFTPDWIVRYMVENSLGRLWMLNNPGSSLRDQMAYYIEPDGEHEDFLHVDGPEDITCCDPACGSGHILVYMFDLLFAMYEERGYRAREIPGLILTKNLEGFEIDERAAQISQLALALKAREHDRRFFERGVQARIHVLESVDINTDALDETSPLRERRTLLEALAHLGEIGSLLNPTEEDLNALRAEAARGGSSDLFASNAGDDVKRALDACEALSTRFDVVVANPPYMGSSSFNPFMSKWIKKNYPDVKSDLCTCFIERGYGLAKDQGYSAMVTMQSWMFLGSFEKMRGHLIDEKTIVSMAHLGPRAFDAIGGEVVSVTADVLYNGKANAKGSYVRLVDINGSDPKRKKLIEAIANPNCGYFYQADAKTFHDIPGSPIAYWLGEGTHQAFKAFPRLDSEADARVGLINGDGNRFLRLWPEVSFSKIPFSTLPGESNKEKWVPYTKGGEFKLWYGNFDYVVNWENDGYEMINDNYDGRRLKAHNFNGEQAFKRGITWNSISSSAFHCRYVPDGFMFDAAGPLCEVINRDKIFYVLGLLSSSVYRFLLGVINPTLNFPPGYLACLPYAEDHSEFESIETLSKRCVEISKSDWDSQETSWDFTRHPLL